MSEHITFDPETRLFHLYAGRSLYAFKISSEGLLENLYFGETIPPNADILYLEKRGSSLRPQIFEPRPEYCNETGKSTTALVFDDDQLVVGKNASLLEYSDFGTGDFRRPALQLQDRSGSRLSPLMYKSHKIQLNRKERLEEPWPSVRREEDGGLPASSLIVTLEDTHTGLEVDLVYNVIHDLDVLTRFTVLRNVNEKAGKDTDLFIDRMMSLCLDLEKEADGFNLIQLSGSWSNERSMVETRLVHGVHAVDSTRGTSSHQQNPFVAVSRGGPFSEETGETIGLALVYSGNFLFEAEVNPSGQLRMLMGLHPLMHWVSLKQGETFTTPEAVIARSSQGLGGLSREMHRLVRGAITPPQWRGKPCPVLINSWEAMYFSVNHENVMEMARVAKSMDIELFVLDDGWFGERDDATSSLGDWHVNKKKFPGGIKQLSEDMNSIGMEFGIWVEPEMISEKSELYKEHPEWAIQAAGRRRQLGRDQFVLDLSRQEVRDHIFKKLEVLFDSCPAVSYVKWDMNRYITDMDSAIVGPHRKGELYHRFVEGFYDVCNRFTKKFPHIRLEHCSGGGGRFDLGTLYFAPQIWTSDNTDVLSRVYIQWGTSMGYPVSSMGAHFAADPCHVTGRTFHPRTRAILAMSGTFGYELDPRPFSEAEKEMIRRQVKAHKKVAQVVQDGDLYRLWDPHKNTNATATAWMLVTPDKKRAVVWAVAVQFPFWVTGAATLRLKGLREDADYVVSEPLPHFARLVKETTTVKETSTAQYVLGSESVRLNGKALTHAGIPVNFISTDDAAMYLLEMVE
uniref:alpha-galactosidase n=1 Tax=Chromera velia CCMP2878 TaxID=1169474 RepID=A0A0G4HV15_9ALVE|mmetsp:Transcript_47936/g.94570  ORF Transcript_47936/g.94570 Transcript_47936/m.94570 type:complete len:795 (-) Transcript_47936:446-2830(-)|eukprot:Cvel_8772.t1-p1 / transcript=Cvel_8772.t1 / gene=Cvel_8772 / organism=Chromera_velia_CCMP2878 / gene_product=Alpha-galactosidase 1, putative / transcript_product=Alpha-galactosidase 1, putative / location=Cvel_scaffold490:62299-70170(+) / protein_length=794 / sequence_SO=supercontig / SO=protein_coding / is_pseudo=false